MPAPESIAATHTLRMRSLLLVIAFPPCLLQARHPIEVAWFVCLWIVSHPSDVAGELPFQLGTMPTRAVNGLATASLPSTILSASAGKEREAGPSMTAAPSRGL